MTIKTNITESDFIKINYQLLWMKPMVKILAAFCLFLIAYHFYALTYEPAYNGNNILLYFGLIVFWVVMIWFVARRNYRSNKRIQEGLSYTIDPDKLTIAGNSFHVELSWDKVYRIVRTKKWVLVFQSRQSANLIDINHCDSAVMYELKSICSHHNIKNNL